MKLKISVSNICKIPKVVGAAQPAIKQKLRFFLPFLNFGASFLSYNMSASLTKVFRFANRVLIACLTNTISAILYLPYNWFSH